MFCVKNGSNCSSQLLNLHLIIHMNEHSWETASHSSQPCLYVLYVFVWQPLGSAWDLCLRSWQCLRCEGEGGASGGALPWLMSSQEAVLASLKLASCCEAIRVLTAPHSTSTVTLAAFFFLRSIGPHSTLCLFFLCVFCFYLLTVIIFSLVTLSMWERGVFRAAVEPSCARPSCAPVFRHSWGCSLVFWHGIFRSLVGGLDALVISFRSHLLYLPHSSTHCTNRATQQTCITFKDNVYKQRYMGKTCRFLMRGGVCVSWHRHRWSGLCGGSMLCYARPGLG